MNTVCSGIGKKLVLGAGLGLLAAAGWAQSYTIQNLGVLQGTDKGRARDVNNKGHVTGYCDITATSKSTGYFWSPETGMVSIVGIGTSHNRVYGLGINESDTVAGEQQYPLITDITALTWNSGTTALIPDTNDAGMDDVYFDCTDINDMGAVCGTSRGLDGVQEATIYHNGQHNLLGRYSTDKRSFAKKINNLNHAVGSSSDNPSNIDHPVFWTGTQWRLLNGLGGEITFLTDLNDSDLVVGASAPSGNMITHACYWVNAGGNPVDMGTLGGSTSAALAVNNKGDIIGISYLADNTTIHPFLYRNGTMTDFYDLLPPDTEDQWSYLYPYAISDTGYICGDGIFNGLERPFLMIPNPPPGTVARYLFDGGAEGWTPVTDIPPFQPGVSSTPSSALGLSPGNDFPVFCFWQSPEITVEKGKTYRATFTMTSTVLQSNDVPQFRLRVFQTSNNLAWFTAPDSVGGQPPAAGEVQTYDVVFTPDMPGATDTVRLYLDLTHFNPFDDGAGTVILQEVTVIEGIFE